MANLPRGVRNNNPGNIDYHANTPWQGLALPPSDGRFCRFVEPKWGIRAIAKVLVVYQDKHKIRTVRGVINRWAPPVENNTNSYINVVCKKLGVTPDQTINLHEYATMSALVQAIIRHENGKPRIGDDWYPQSTIDNGLLLAGIVPPNKTLAKSKTVIGTTTSGLGGALGLAADNASHISAAGAQLSATGIEFLKIAAGILIVIGTLLALYGRV